MDNNFIDYDTLGQFVDELMRRRPLPANTAEELNTIREKTIKDLDDEIGMAIFGRLTTDQLMSFNELLDGGTNSPDAFQKFFDDAGINLQEVVSNAMTEFGKEFLGGQNA